MQRPATNFVFQPDFSIEKFAVERIVERNAVAAQHPHDIVARKRVAAGPARFRTPGGAYALFGEIEYGQDRTVRRPRRIGGLADRQPPRSEEHTSELQSLMRISYAVFCLKKKKTNTLITTVINQQTH